VPNKKSKIENRKENRKRKEKRRDKQKQMPRYQIPESIILHKIPESRSDVAGSGSRAISVCVGELDRLDRPDIEY
jgi:hypothetical protein